MGRSGFVPIRLSLLALSLGTILALAPAFGVGRARAASTSGLSAASAASRPESAPLVAAGLPATVSIELGKLVKVEVPIPPTVEVSVLPKVEAKVEVPLLPKVEAKVEVPSTPKAEAPSPPEVEAPSTPTGSTPVSLPTSPTVPTSEAPALAAKSLPKTTTNATAASVPSPAPATSTSEAGSEVSNAEAVKLLPSAGSRPSSPKRPRRRGRPSLARPLANNIATLAPAVSLPARSTSSSHTSHVQRTGTDNPLESIGRHIPLPVPVPDWSKPIILLLLLLAVWFGVRSRLAARRSRRLERQSAALMQDLGVMQAALVPVIPERLGSLAVSVAYEPADGPAAGGDFYDLFPLESGKIGVIVGDVAGHGHEALTQAALTRYTLRAYLQAGLEPRAALALGGTVLVDQAACHFATVVVSVYDPSSGRLTYSSAGHPPPIAVGFRAPEPLNLCCSPPLGWNVPTGRRQTTLSIPQGAGMCFFSDGLIEARTEDGLLGRERLSEILAELGPDHRAADLLERVRACSQSTPDDMVSCIIVPEVDVTVTASQVEELEVDSETLGRAPVAQFLQACQVAPGEIAGVLARAREVAGIADTAVLRVQRPVAGEASCAPGRASVAVLPGLGAPAVTPAEDVKTDERPSPRTLVSAG